MKLPGRDKWLLKYILNHRVAADGTDEYLVSWVNHESTWIKKAFVLSKKAITDFEYVNTFRTLYSATPVDARPLHADLVKYQIRCAISIQLAIALRPPWAPMGKLHLSFPGVKPEIFFLVFAESYFEPGHCSPFTFLTQQSTRLVLKSNKRFRQHLSIDDDHSWLHHSLPSGRSVYMDAGLLRQYTITYSHARTAQRHDHSLCLKCNYNGPLEG